MKKLPLLILLITLIPTALSSQKNAPVAGDASILIDLLRKDYKAYASDLLDEEIAKDRAQVISIFKNYLTDTQKKFENIDKSRKNTITTEYGLILANFNAKQKAFTTYSTLENINRTVTEIKVDKDNLNKILSDLNYYKKELYQIKFSKDIFELEAIMKEFSDNQYLKHIITKFIEKYNSLKTNSIDYESKSNQSAAIQKSIPFLGGDVGFEMVIDGLSKFLAKRIKEELTTYVIEEVKAWLENPGQNDPIAELKVILPRTNTYLLKFTANQVTNFPNQIKQYIEDDFNHIFENAGNLKNTPRIQKLIEKYPDIDFAMEAIEMIPNLAKIKNPMDYFELLENSRNLDSWKFSDNQVKYNIANTLSLSTMLAHSFTFIENGQPRFVGTDFISGHGSEEEFYLLYTGFLYQQSEKYYDVNFKNSSEEISFKNLLKNIVKEDPAASVFLKDKLFFQKLFKDISKNAEKVLVGGNEMKKVNKNGLKIGPDTLNSYINSIINLAEDLTYGCDTLINYLRVKSNPAVNSINFKLNIRPYFDIAHKMNEILLDFQKKRYSTGLIKTLEITNHFMSRTKNWDGEDILKNIRDLGNLEQKNLSIKMHASDWHKLNDILYSSSFPIRTGQADTINKIVQILKKAVDFYYEKYSSIGSELNNLVKLSSILNNLALSKSISPADKVEALIIIRNPSIQKIILSTFLGYNISDDFELINNKLTDIKIREVEVFTAPDIATLKVDLNAFHDGIFNYLLDGNKVTFETAKKNFLTSTFKLLVKMPKSNHKSYDRVTKLIHFINDIAVSKDSDGIAKAIENFALPAGSYAIKRESKFNVSLNSFPGLIIGTEILWKNKIAYGSFSPSFTAPVGISFTWGTKNNRSSGLFIPIIDIGAMTRIYLGDNKPANPTAEISKFPEFSFLSIFSPGLYYHLGLSKTPISFNFGFQYGPGLREINNNGDSKIHESIRIGVGAVLDIPLLNLHNKPKL